MEACQVDSGLGHQRCESGPGLLGLMSADELFGFIREAHRYGLICGLPGRLRAEDIDQSSRLRADYLGFRGALCRNSERESDLSLVDVLNVRACIDLASKRGENRLTGHSNADTLIVES